MNDFLTILFVGMMIGAILSLRRMWIDARQRKDEQRRRQYQKHIQEIVESFDDGRMKRVSAIKAYFDSRR
jgi:uncharacterized membrane protein (DUF106 family)